MDRFESSGVICVLLPPIKIRIRVLLAVFFAGLIGATLWALGQSHAIEVLAAQAGDSTSSAQVVAKAKVFSHALMAFSLLVGVVGLVAWAYFDREVFTAIDRLSRHMTELAARNYDQNVEGKQRSDEIGEMARAVDVLRANGIELMRLEQEAARRADVIAAERRAALQTMGEQLETQVASLLEGLTRSSQAMILSSEQMSESAFNASESAGKVARVASQTSDSAQKVAMTVQELSQTADSIAESTQVSTQVSARASEEAESTSALMSRLGRSADEISAVVDMITQIAQQTNLLALNATIEAARAGEHGAGFAVVAAEVKTLSQQTERATSEITGKVRQIQDDAGGAVSAIADIVRTIADLRSGANEIARSVAAQQMATSQIADTVESLAAGSQTVGLDIDSVRDAANETGQVASVVFEEAKSVADAAERLRGELARFLESVRAA